MATPMNEKQLVSSWAKAHEEYEAAKAASDDAQRKAQGHAKAIYDAFQSEVFTVKDRGFRAIKKPARNGGEPTYAVIPIPENKPTRKF